MLKRILELLFPPKCILCRRVLEKNETDLCCRCRTDSSDAPASRTKLSFVESWAAVWYYEGKVRSSILRFKFGGRQNYAPAYGRLLAMKLQREYPEGFDLLTWVPTGKRRIRKRGYDQAKLLAEAVGSELEMMPVQLLKKIRDNPPQSGIRGDAKRRANVLGAYKETENIPFSGKRILLLDDVITTGATVSECSRILLTAGAKEVHCGALAYARRSKR
jgi:ComF family protein